MFENIKKELDKKEEFARYRVDFTDLEIKSLIDFLEHNKHLASPFDEEFVKKIDDAKSIKKSISKIQCTKTATEARTKKAKEKIQNAINLMRLENEKLTYYSIAKKAEVSYLTVKKYITLNEIN